MHDRHLCVGRANKHVADLKQIFKAACTSSFCTSLHVFLSLSVYLFPLILTLLYIKQSCPYKSPSPSANLSQCCAQEYNPSSNQSIHLSPCVATGRPESCATVRLEMEEKRAQHSEHSIPARIIQTIELSASAVLQLNHLGHLSRGIFSSYKT